jgi:hypothetical protein
MRMSASKLLPLALLIAFISDSAALYKFARLLLVLLMKPPSLGGATTVLAVVF